MTKSYGRAAAAAHARPPLPHYHMTTTTNTAPKERAPADSGGGGPHACVLQPGLWDPGCVRCVSFLDFSNIYTHAYVPSEDAHNPQRPTPTGHSTTHASMHRIQAPTRRRTARWMGSRPPPWWPSRWTPRAARSSPSPASPRISRYILRTYTGKIGPGPGDGMAMPHDRSPLT